jgi:hypothetical protein
LSEFYEAGKIGNFLPKLGEMRVHPKVYAEIQRGEHVEELRPVLSLHHWGEWDVIVTTEIPADRIVFVVTGHEAEFVVTLLSEEEREMREIEELRRLLTELHDGS